MNRLLAVLAVGVALGFLLAASAQAALIDVTVPTDPLVRVDGVDDDGDPKPPPGAEDVDKAIDNTTTKYLNFYDLGSGFIVTPAAGSTTVTGLRLYTANDAEDRDPASYLLEGSNAGDGGPFALISQGPLALPAARNGAGQPMATPGLYMQELTFANGVAYTTYQLTFPTLKNAGATNSMQIGEVELLAEGAAPPPPPPGFDLIDPTDPIVGTSNNWPGGPGGPGEGPGGPEGPAQAIDDNDGTKYLNFDGEGSGFTVTLATNGPAELNGIALLTANDSPERDPASVTIRGSNDGMVWDPIITDLATLLPDDRFTDTEFGFSPETPGAYSMYEVVFPTLKDAAAANSMQIGEVRLLPEPATLALLGLGVIGLVSRRRRA